MAVSSRPDHFFQTTSSLDEIERRRRKSTNKSGDPIKLQSKILAVATDPYAQDDTFYVAESASTIRGISLSSGKVTSTWTGPTAPVTSLCFSSEKATGKSIWAGCWDKKIYQWSVEPAISPSKPVQGANSQLAGHTDFVKCILTVRAPDGELLVVSGGAEGDIIFWNSSGKRLHVLKGESRGIEHLLVDPLSDPEAPVIFVATSQRDLYYFTLPASTALKSTRLSQPILAHETSVYTLYFDTDGDLWTASADKTAKHLVRDDGWKSDTTLQHPDFVRDIVVHDRGGWVITACRDEEVRVWNRATGELYHTFSGHFEEVTGLCLMGDTLVSVGIDATARRWSLAPRELQRAVEEARTSKDTKIEEPERQPDAGGMLTAEEEAELREVMENEERELHELIALGEQ